MREEGEGRRGDLGNGLYQINKLSPCLGEEERKSGWQFIRAGKLLHGEVAAAGDLLPHLSTFVRWFSEFGRHGFFPCMHADETKVHTGGDKVKARRDGHYPFIALFCSLPSLLNIPYYHRQSPGATYAGDRITRQRSKSVSGEDLSPARAPKHR